VFFSGKRDLQSTFSGIVKTWPKAEIEFKENEKENQNSIESSCSTQEEDAPKRVLF
jgi:hypothetical protein